MNEYEDTIILCKDCQQKFVWTAGEKKFLDDLMYAGKIPVAIAPVRCRPCKQNRQKLFEKTY